MLPQTVTEKTDEQKRRESTRKTSRMRRNIEAKTRKRAEYLSHGSRYIVVVNMEKTRREMSD